MKKILTWICILAIVLSFGIIVSANAGTEAFTASAGVSEVAPGEIFTVTVSANDVDLSKSASFKLTYDASKLHYEGATNLMDTQLTLCSAEEKTYGEINVVMYDKNVRANGEIFSFDFYAFETSDFGDLYFDFANAKIGKEAVETAGTSVTLVPYSLTLAMDEARIQQGKSFEISVVINNNVALSGVTIPLEFSEGLAATACNWSIFGGTTAFAGDTLLASFGEPVELEAGDTIAVITVAVDAQCEIDSASIGVKPASVNGYPVVIEATGFNVICAQHSWSNVKSAAALKSAATCTEDAVYYKTCSNPNCNEISNTETFVDMGSKLGHNWVYSEANLKDAASCTADANYWNVCDRNGCGVCARDVADAQDKFSAKTGTALNHPGKTETPKVDADCTTDGKEAYWYCPECEKYFEDEACTKVIADIVAYGIINATGHLSVTPTAKQDATCTVAGKEAYWYCADCKTYFSDADCTQEIADIDAYGIISATGHLSVTSTAKQDATCTAAGKEAYWYCADCKTYFSDADCTQEIADINTYGVISMLSHTYDKEVATDTYLKTAATCTAKAVYYKSCVCGLASTTDTFESGDFAAHIYNKEVATDTYLKTAATCTAKAVYYKSCVCGAASATDTFESGDPLGHQSVTPTAKQDATCTATGKEAYWYCADCKTYFSDEDCTKVIADINAYGIIAALNHPGKEEHAKKEPTCVDSGMKAYWHCPECQKDFWDEACTDEIDNVNIDCYIAPNGHSYTDYIIAEKVYEKKAATCTDDAIYWLICDVEGCLTCAKDDPDAQDKFAAKAGTALNHPGKAHTDKVDSTCLEEGKEEYWYCETCEKYFSDEACTAVITDIDAFGIIAPINHENKIHHDEDAPKCTSTGTVEYWYCPDCDKNYSDEACTQVIENLNIDMLGHTLVLVPLVKATDKADGHLAYYDCSVCDFLSEDENGEKQIDETWVEGDGKIAKVDLTVIKMADVNGIEKNKNTYSATATGVPVEAKVNYDKQNLTAAGNYTVKATVTPADPELYDFSMELTATVLIKKSTLTDSSNTDVIVADATKGIDPAGTLSVKSVDVKSDDAKAAMNAIKAENGKNLKAVAMYDVNILVAGKSVQPDGSVVYTLKVPEKLNGKEFELYNVQTDANGNKTVELLATTENADGTVSAKVNSIADLVFARRTLAAGWIVLIVIASVAVVAVACWFIFLKDIVLKKKGGKKEKKEA